MDSLAFSCSTELVCRWTRSTGLSWPRPCKSYKVNGCCLMAIPPRGRERSYLFPAWRNVSLGMCSLLFIIRFLIFTKEKTRWEPCHYKLPRIPRVHLQYLLQSVVEKPRINDLPSSCMVPTSIDPPYPPGNRNPRKQA